MIVLFYEGNNIKLTLIFKEYLAILKDLNLTIYFIWHSLLWNKKL